MNYPYEVRENDSKIAGQSAGRRQVLDYDGRFSVQPVHTVFDRLGWALMDSEVGLVIMVAESYDQAVQMARMLEDE